jgi:hypothetical protein
MTVTVLIKSRTIRWAESLARMGGSEMHARLCVGNLGERDHLEDIVVDGGIKIQLILNKYGWKGVDWTRQAKDR